MLDVGEWHHCVIVTLQDVEHCMRRVKFPEAVIHVVALK